ncbi:MAG TPA: GNAT family N-acetyltransferase [Allosphingosinicella sp.]
MVPILETARLRLRAFRKDDLAAWAPVMADPEVARYLGGTPFSREETWRRVLSSTGAWPILGFGYWAVERKAEGDLIGQAGFADFSRDMQPAIEGLPEMGWIFAPHAHGQGYATEAVQAALAWADAYLKAPVIPAIIDHGNIPSIRLAERCGFTGREEATYRGAPILLLRRLR